MRNVLEVRLQRPTAPDLALVDYGDKAFITTNGPGRAVQPLKIGIKCLRPGRNACIGCRDAELVLRSLVAETDELDAGVGVKIDDVPVRRAIRSPRKNSNAPIVIMADAIDILLEHGVN